MVGHTGDSKTPDDRWRKLDQGNGGPRIHQGSAWGAIKVTIQVESMCSTQSTQSHLRRGQGEMVCCGWLRCLAPWSRGRAVACNVAYFPTSVTAFQELSGQPSGPTPWSLWGCGCSVMRAPFLVTFPIISPSHPAFHGGGSVQHMFNLLTFCYGICQGPWRIQAEMFSQSLWQQPPREGLKGEFFLGPCVECGIPHACVTVEVCCVGT